VDREITNEEDIEVDPPMLCQVPEAVRQVEEEVDSRSSDRSRHATVKVNEVSVRQALESSIKGWFW